MQLNQRGVVYLQQRLYLCRQHAISGPQTTNWN